MNRQEAERAARKAEIAQAAGELDRALEIYTELERARPNDGRWSHCVADIHRRRGDTPKELLALVRAADRYLAEGAPLRSLVMCKRLLSSAPDLPDTERCLSALHPMIVASSGPERPLPVDVPLSTEAWMPVGAPLAELPIAQTVGASKPESEGWPAEVELSTKLAPEWSDLEAALMTAASEPAKADAFEEIEEEISLELSAPSAPAEGPRTDPSRLGEVASEGRGKGWTLRMTPLFAALGESTFRTLMTKLRVVELTKDQILFRQGSPGDSLYMICMGSVSVVREPEELELARLDEAEFFGEIALVTNQPRTATVRALTDTLLIEIDRHMVSELIYEDGGIMPVLLWFIRDRLVDTLVRTSPMFSQFPYVKRRALTDRFRFLESYKDTELITEGERAKGLVIVLAGRARVTRKSAAGAMELASLASGGIAGEMSLLTWEPAVATVTARGHFVGLFLSAEDFKQMVVDHPGMKEHLEHLADVRRQRLVEALDAESWPESKLPLV